MTTDLEQRLHDELVARAGDAAPSRLGGGAVRRVAAARRRRRVRAGTTAGGAALAAVVAAGLLLPGNGPEATPPAGPTGSPTGATTADDLVRVPVPPADLERAYSVMAGGRPDLLAATRLPGSGDTVLVFDGEEPGDHRSVVRTVTLAGDEALAGTLAYYERWDHLVAQPARDGTGAALVVVAPAASVADAVEVTTSLPGKDIAVTRVALDRRLAVVPVPSATSVTRVRLLHGASMVEDRIPGDYYLSPAVPRPLGRVVVEAGPVQPVQVRTDGTTACRLTVTGQGTVSVLVLPWNPIDEACAVIDPDRLQLLLAEDRRYSSVAGVAPPGTTSVRLRWRDGRVTETPVAADEVPAFVDVSDRRPDRLVRAEALAADGSVLATARP